MGTAGLGCGQCEFWEKYDVGKAGRSEVALRIRGGWWFRVPWGFVGVAGGVVSTLCIYEHGAIANGGGGNEFCKLGDSFSVAF